MGAEATGAKEAGVAGIWVKAGSCFGAEGAMTGAETGGGDGVPPVLSV